MREPTNLDAALARARHEVEAAPQDADALGKLGALLIEVARRSHADSAHRPGAMPPEPGPLYLEAARRLAEAQRLGNPQQVFHAALYRGIALREFGDLEAAHAAFAAAAQMRPADERAQRELAASYQCIGEHPRAIELYRALIARNPGDALAHTELGQCLLSEGDFAQGWDEYEWRLRAPDAASAREFPFRAWRGEPLAGRTLLVRSEQGVGDEIMFASCLPEAIRASGHCVIECSRRLAALFRRSFSRATVLERNLAAPPDWSALPHIDLQVMAGSLPGRFRRRAEEFPGRAYLVPDPAAVALWRERLGGQGRAVGLAWSGGLPSTLRAARSLELEQLAPLLAVSGVRFVSLELYDREKEIATIGGRYGVHIASFKGLGGDVDELAAAIAALDLVITVPTTVAHVAGAVGVPTWVMAPRVATWRYLRSGERMPWYGSVRLFRRSTDTTMEAFIAGMGKTLADWVAS
jgi:tetratricopeptide (TPR) repeat protein